MFNSFTSFLPSLHLPGANERNGPTSPLPLNPNNTAEEQEAECEAETRPSEEGELGKKGKTKGPNETFIFVRPPPAKSNHPLNLQVQLVPPAPLSQRQSIDSEPDTPVTTSSLTRTSSNRSEASSYGSTASLASTASSTSSGRRTIIPLYNLQAHNVMTNVIVDAGTDAKIAKFQRRGIELIDLALLEPVEVWGERKGPAKPSRPATPDLASTTAASSNTSLPSTAQSHSVASSSPQASNPSLQRDASPSFMTTKQNRLAEPKRNIFGKMFRKGKEGTPPPPSPTTVSSPLGSGGLLNTKTPTQSTPYPEATPRPDQLTPRRQIRPVSSVLSSLRDRSASPSKRSSIGLGLTVPGQEANQRSSIDLTPIPGSPGPTPTAATQDEKILRPPVLGIQPTLSFSYAPSATASVPAPVHISNLGRAARALMYVWFVRRWFKQRADEEDNGGLLSVVRHAKRASNLSSGSAQGGPADEGVEVRFEWKRSNAKKKSGKEKERGRRPGTSRSRKDMAAAAGEGIKEKDFQPSPSMKNKRLSVASTHSISTNVSVSEDGHTNSPYMRRSREGEREDGAGEEDDGEDSDPEDSETPWVCTLKIRRTGATLRPSGSNLSVNRPGSRNGSAIQPPTPPQVLRIKVGTLSPTPHHPKVVGMLKVPFPLPDIEIERMGLVKRPMGPPGVRPPPSTFPGTTLTAEEIKDIVCSTGMWLVVREGFGGVGKVSRKGDGWRIRA